jgi:hypothetical protein
MPMTRGPGLLAIIAILSAAGCLSEGRYPPGEIAPDDPIQEALTSAQVHRVGTYAVRPVARFEIEARVLSRERYRFDRGATLSPVDLALGWGPMSDQRVLDQIDISQGGRFYRWRVKKYPIPRQQIIAHSANMHMIPANDDVRKDLLAVRTGEVVHLEGYLVVATAEDGAIWKTSLTRQDSGNGACELVWIEKIISYSPDMGLTSF